MWRKSENFSYGKLKQPLNGVASGFIFEKRETSSQSLKLSG